MKIINKIFSPRGEIATFLTLISVGLMLLGVVAGSQMVRMGPRFSPSAAAPQASCTGSCTNEDDYCATCKVPKEQQFCPSDAGLTMIYQCKSGNWVYQYPECQTACKPDIWQPSPVPTTVATCPSGQWSCKGQCADQQTRELFNNTWCNGEKRWLWEVAGLNADCRGEASVPKSSPECTGGTISSPTPIPSAIPSAAPNPTRTGSPGGFHLTSDVYAEKATDGIKFNVHILFNSDGCDGDIKLYRDGAHVAGPNGWNIKMGPFDYNQEWAGSFTLKKGESISPGYEGTVDRCPKSPVTLRDGISCTLAVDGSGNPGVTGAGCTFKNQSDFSAYNPASPTLGVPSGAGGKYKCQDLTSSPNKDCNDTMVGPCEYGTYKYKCTSTACPSNKSVGVGIPFWCDGDKWYDVNKLGECIGACTPAGSPTPTPSSECQGKADGYVISSCIQQECEVPNKKWINLEKVCQGGIVYTKPGKLTSDACNPSADKFRACVISQCTPGFNQQICAQPDAPYVKDANNQCSVILPSPAAGCSATAACYKCQKLTNIPPPAGLPPGPTGAGGPTLGPTIGLTKRINVKYIHNNAGWTDDKATLYLESKGKPIETYSLYREGFGSKTYSSLIDMEIGREYTAKIRITYNVLFGPSDCLHEETSVAGGPIKKTIAPTDTEWKIYGSGNQSTDCNPATRPTDIPGTADSMPIALRYHLGNVCWGINCNLPEEWAEVFLSRAGKPVQKVSLPKEPYAGPGVGFQVYSKQVDMEINKEYTAKVRVKYKVSNQQCLHEDTVKNTLQYDRLEWDIHGSLNATVDCLDVNKRMSVTLAGSSNQAFLLAMNRYAKGEMGVKEMSAFISQLSRTPGTQVQLVPCDYTQPQCGFNI